MAKKKKAVHGGRREGAGRPVADPDGRTLIVTASVPGEIAERLDAYAAKMGWNRSRTITEAIRGLLDAKH